VSVYQWQQWLVALHVIAVIAWMAGILYLPRLFVYHADAKPGSDKSETFKVMERRLLRAIMMPAMIVTWSAGLALALWRGLYDEPWLMTKVALVVAMTGVHFWLAARQRDFARDANIYSARTYRIMNEVPTLLLIAIVILVIVRPF
jgi:protoporphyrinogen IX oxidase